MMAIQTTTNLPSLKGLLQGLVSDSESFDIPVSGISTDSRKVNNGDVFIALDGSRTSGKVFVQEAVDKGATAILLESLPDNLDIKPDVPLIIVKGLKSNLGLLASRVYHDPSREIKIIGITGTNGKTSIAYYLAQLFSVFDKDHVGSIGTIGAGVFGKLQPKGNTTPDIISINELLNEFREKKIKHVVMEVSSHGLDQGRVDNIRFETAVFTNLSRDHLDYHGDMHIYGEAKKKLFTSPELKNAVINIDDEFGNRLFSDIHKQVNTISYGIDGHSGKSGVKADVYAEIIKQGINSLTLKIHSPWGNSELTVPLTSRFNAYNILACVAVMSLHGMSFHKLIENLSGLVAVPGRMEAFIKEGNPGIFVDYSHTPDALMQALISLREYCDGQLICVFGCGGDRDKGKRSLMGSVAELYADQVYLTSDNPRTEPPDQILKDIRNGMKGLVPVELQPDRTIAISNAFKSANPDDIILIAGKGHETYQEIGHSKLPFSDRQLVRNLLEDGE
jgi:UDP-N-acetylmuramoyl-L-alanyl-D-glutamate--2,6-diaminopimelate ligase